MIRASILKEETHEITDKLSKKITPQDTIVTKIENKKSYDENGTLTVKRITHRVNITKLVNETSKVVLADVARKKIQELENIFKNKENK